jgi:hypothetical protein
MKPRSLILSADEVRGFLSGSRTQLRRVVKPQPNSGDNGEMVNLGGDGWGLLDGCLSGLWRSPLGAPGDRLWVKETIRAVSHGNGVWTVHYAADDFGVDLSKELPGEQRLRFTVSRSTIPAPQVPYWASRLTLETVEVRVEKAEQWEWVGEFRAVPR